MGEQHWKEPEGCQLFSLEYDGTLHACDENQQARRGDGYPRWYVELEDKNREVDAYRARIAELERIVSRMRDLPADKPYLFVDAPSAKCELERAYQQAQQGGAGMPIVQIKPTRFTSIVVYRADDVCLWPVPVWQRIKGKGFMLSLQFLNYGIGIAVKGGGA